MKIRVALTMGDPAGIGPEIIARSISSVQNIGEIVVIGDRGVFDMVAGTSFCRRRDVRFLDLKNVRKRGFTFGRIKAEYGRASIEYLDKAVDMIRSGAADCLVTCPISKEAVNLAGFRYSGHTEYFISRSGVKDAVMMLLNSKLKFSLVTRHIPLKDVSKTVTQGLLIDTISATYYALKDMFGIGRPRLVACGMNPHASDNGVIGNEELRVIVPALKKLASEGVKVYGPVSADAAVAKAALNEYDGVIAMYHDQALIPLKLTGASSGVNMTLGLPFIRTSPLHGTAFDIAGRNRADPSSLTAAVKLAVRCARNLKKA